MSKTKDIIEVIGHKIEDLEKEQNRIEDELCHFREVKRLLEQGAKIEKDLEKAGFKKEIIGGTEVYTKELPFL